MKVTCDRDEYRDAILRAGGLGELRPISTYTYCDGSPFHGDGRHIYTEWGTKDGEFVAESEEHNGEFTFRVPALPNGSAGPNG